MDASVLQEFQSNLRQSRHILSFIGDIKDNKSISNQSTSTILFFGHVGGRALEAIGRMAIRGYQYAVINVAFRSIERHLPVPKADMVSDSTLGDLRENVMEFAR